MTTNFYDDPENLVTVLTHYISIFSEDKEPRLPIIKTIAGQVDVKRTLALSAYKDFPESEKQIWLNHAH